MQFWHPLPLTVFLYFRHVQGSKGYGYVNLCNVIFIFQNNLISFDFNLNISGHLKTLIFVCISRMLTQGLLVSLNIYNYHHKSSFLTWYHGLHHPMVVADLPPIISSHFGHHPPHLKHLTNECFKIS